MARTHRNLEGMNGCALRKPKTTNERRILNGIICDSWYEDYKISGLNRLHHRYSNSPTAWDDLVISGYRQEDWKV